MNENLAEKFLPLSAYLAPPDDIQPALDKDIRADVAIIGGGWTGLSAALKLRQQGMQVALLEQQHCGYGASGRSGGHLVGPGKESRIFFARPNAAKSKQYTDYISRIVAIAEQQIDEHGIECDYIASGNLFGATHPKMLPPLRAYAAAGKQLGYRVVFWNAHDCRERGIPAAWCGGAYFPDGGSLHPGKYVLGLRRAALNAGVLIFENCPVTAIAEQMPARIETQQGSVLADAVIIASSAFTPATLKRFDRLMGVFRIGAFETAPLRLC